MKAQFASICPDCEKPIREGDEITLDMWRESSGFWTHAKCPESPKAKVCPLCFMEMALSGEHDCEDER